MEATLASWDEPSHPPLVTSKEPSTLELEELDGISVLKMWLGFNERADRVSTMASHPEWSQRMKPGTSSVLPRSSGWELFSSGQSEALTLLQDEGSRCQRASPGWLEHLSWSPVSAERGKPNSFSSVHTHPLPNLSTTALLLHICPSLLCLYRCTASWEVEAKGRAAWMVVGNLEAQLLNSAGVHSHQFCGCVSGMKSEIEFDWIIRNINPSPGCSYLSR